MRVIRSRAIRSVIGFLGHVGIVTGILLVIEAGVTTVWQEPISAFVAARAQAELSDDLEELDQQAVSAVKVLDRGPSDRAIAKRLALRQQGRVETGDAIGRIELPSLDESFAMVEGTGTGPLRQGPGHYEDTRFPGRGGTFAVAGHRTTYLAPFRDVDDLEAGDRIVVSMPYARFTYRVFQTKIVDPSEVWVKRSLGDERVILTACHPPFSAAQRIVVFGKLDAFKLKAGTANG